MTTKDNQFKGYHKFRGERGTEYGSFEVFHFDPSAWPTDQSAGGLTDQGWYWWPCFPGCLPDGAPFGPFPTSEGAYLDAIGD